MKRVTIIGGGVFGLSAALHLVKRHWSVRLFDSGPVPHPEASSTDISKIIRSDYGADDLYLDAMERSFPVWREWNVQWERPLFHQTGFVLLTHHAMQPGDFEYESWTALRARGVRLERMNRAEIGRRFPEFEAAEFGDGYFNPEAGWAESRAVVTRLREMAIGFGVDIRCSTVIRGLDGLNVVTSDGAIPADRIVVAAGVWTPELVSEIRPHIRVVGQPVLHFYPGEPELWRAPRVVPWAGDITRTGWYGFPVNAEGVVKVAHHGPGVECSPAERPVVSASEVERCRAFLRRHLPRLAEAPLAGTRRCMYADSCDGDFWIAQVPGRPGVVVATGGSGHGFKFAPVLGEWIANAVEEKPVPDRFGWRETVGFRHDGARCSST